MRPFEYSQRREFVTIQWGFVIMFDSIGVIVVAIVGVFFFTVPIQRDSEAVLSLEIIDRDEKVL